MKSYLGLIPIAAKVHRRKNRMTLICIIISVLLVTTIFSVSDMMIRTEGSLMFKKHGDWHIQVNKISRSAAEEIGQRSDVTAIGWSEVYNTDADKPYYIGDKKATLYGTDETYITELANGLEEGAFPQNADEVMLSSNAKDAINVQIGDRVIVQTPAGEIKFKVSGFGSDDKAYYQGQTYLIAVSMTQDAFAELKKANNITSTPVCYIQFQDAAKAAKAVNELIEEYDLPEDSVSENTAIMGISGRSSNEGMISIYGMAAVLFLLVLIAGVLMISGSMNSNVSQRTQFFGMMRCIGASKQQIVRFVRLEALNWCKIAVPIGVVLGTAMSWGICAVLHYGIGGEFITTPVFQISMAGLVSGVAVGVVTVLFAAQSPARHAAKVSPVAAIAGNSENVSVNHAAKCYFRKVEWMLGVHHAVDAKKNWFLMTSSFTLSIVMFLCFSVGMNLARELLPSLRSWQPDITLNGYANAPVLDRNMTEKISSIEGVKNVYGCMYRNDIPASSSQSKIDHINLVSYDSYMLKCAKSSLAQGNISEVYGDSNHVLIIHNKNNPLSVGDTIQFEGTEVEVAGALSDGLFSEDLIIICSQETFDRIMGEQKYTFAGIKLKENATEQTVKKISSMISNDVIFSDEREYNKEIAATFWATRIVGYGFLLIIGMITAFNIINSISMSVSARIKQYGAMRAVGMDSSQLTRMILGEALTYAFSGLAAGCAIGLPLHRFLYTGLVTRYFGNPWTLPVILIFIIVLFVCIAAMAAVYAPAKRICSMAVTDTINEL